MSRLYTAVQDLLTNPKHSRWICPLLLTFDACLCAAIILKVPYTEIDWSTYMQHIHLFLSGERDYTAIKGSTGPLVYPAGHVYAYTALYNVTDEGRDVPFAQTLFAALYLIFLATVMACYRAIHAPPYIYPLLVLSKRLHSIFMLRMFNDGLAAGFIWAAVYMMLKRQWYAGVLLWTLSVSIKMTGLLAAPAIAVILTFAVGFGQALGMGVFFVLVQILLGLPFLLENPTGYMTRAFEFTRQFLFKWTVNWRFIGEDVFLSRPFSVALLAVHISLLVTFLAYVWILPAKMDLGSLVQQTFRGRNLQRNISNSYVATTMMTSVVIGLLCARSLHYQFYAYLVWTTPLILWKSGFHPVLVFILWAAQEWAWNVYPSTNVSSTMVVGCLALQVLGVFWGMQCEEQRLAQFKGETKDLIDNQN
ncbi:dolichyl-P-Man:Man(5)GlcNAc(2)-PP-dolichyl mannosyltransferase [Trichophyton tonsurans CBS 112818]|uniref:Dol-P-Man:Man(5)GlcNAc(2)-PP-Dol alpha-1,3-mannosyltransferase n=2 Tax=Trichophyton TaxID=5550 RepID=F2PUQ0_TRIEC|nr:dolichyl-P-Man:Man(5)GlcNAc(2)-PP-dolichyl mannosyltransferase [Trichophyton tonsurans CBS 112818]EGE05618.1 dolichyl-P-Man:Man(5)GlcNAc(2)-PP-dolichyl mannosyltransferase [Trichophyton equinum CBS 127.97]